MRKEGGRTWLLQVQFHTRGERQELFLLLQKLDIRIEPNIINRLNKCSVSQTDVSVRFKTNKYYKLTRNNLAGAERC